MPLLSHRAGLESRALHMQYLNYYFFSIRVEDFNVVLYSLILCIIMHMPAHLFAPQHAVLSKIRRSLGSKGTVCYEPSKPG